VDAGEERDHYIRHPQSMFSVGAQSIPESLIVALRSAMNRPGSDLEGGSPNHSPITSNFKPYPSAEPYSIWRFQQE